MTATLVTALAVGGGVAASDLAAPVRPASAGGDLSAAGAQSATETTPNRTLGTSRSLTRVPLVSYRKPKVTGRLWTTAPLDLRVEPREKSRRAGLVKPERRVAVTGRRQNGFAEVVVGDLPRWVSAKYLAKSKPKPKPSSPDSASAGLSNAPCADGSDIESGLQPASVRVYRAACAAFPELTTYGGQDGHGEHVNGEAIDFMVPSSSVGQRLADYLFAHRGELDLFDIIWSQRIWTIERSGEGFRSMSDRGSATANHFDHVHIKVN